MPKSTQVATAACPHRPPCPGCPRFLAGGIAPAAAAALATLARDVGLQPPCVVEGAPFGHRVRARLAVRGRATSPEVGLFQEESHRIVDIPHCPIHHPRINEVAGALREAMRATGTPPYADGPHRGVVRYLQVVVERSSRRVQVVVVCNGTEAAPLHPLFARLTAALGDTLHSLWWNGNPARTNVILGPSWERLAGPPAVVEPIGGAEVFFPPGAFGQANLDLADQLVAQVSAWVPDGARVLEFHAGCGAIGLGLATRARRVVFNEVSPAGLDGLERGMAALPPDARARTSVLAGPAGAHLDALADADVVIVDPPRKGLEPAVLAALAARRPARVIAVSCSLPAFLGEARTLHDAGLALRALVPYVLVPHTDHVETVALFEAVRTTSSRT